MIYNDSIDSPIESPTEVIVSKQDDSYTINFECKLRLNDIWFSDLITKANFNIVKVLLESTTVENRPIIISTLDFIYGVKKEINLVKDYKFSALCENLYYITGKEGNLKDTETVEFKRLLKVLEGEYEDYKKQLETLLTKSEYGKVEFKNDIGYVEIYDEDIFVEDKEYVTVQYWDIFTDEIKTKNVELRKNE